MQISTLQLNCQMCLIFLLRNPIVSTESLPNLCLANQVTSFRCTSDFSVPSEETASFTTNILESIRHRFFNSAPKASNLLSRYPRLYLQMKGFLLPSPRPPASPRVLWGFRSSSPPSPCSTSFPIYRPILSSLSPTCSVLPNPKTSSSLRVFLTKLQKQSHR